MPGSRQLCAYWIKDDNLYLYGGNGLGASANGYLNDLWKYSIIDGQWIFLSGSGNVSVNPTHGTQNQPSVNNSPGSRLGGCFWTSGTGDVLYFFGGTFSDPLASLSFYNDLWEYSITDNTWTWISGSNLPNDSGVSGELGVPSMASRPAARLTAVSFAQNNFLWLFGGYTTSYSNDLWRYTIATGEWTWMGGDVNPGNTGAYIEQGIPGNGNYPRNRESGFGWKSGSGKFWMYGGQGNVGGSMNDLWSLEVSPDAPATACTALSGTLQDGLVGYWPFCGNANDESGNGYDGVHYLFDGISFYPNPDISSSYGTDRFGNLQAALSTNVYAANVMIPVTNEIFQGDFSINVWAKNDSILSQYPRILGSENHHLNMQYGNTGGPVNFGAYMTEEGIPPFAGVGEVINPYEWVNITLVNEDYINRLYFNGILVDEASDFNVNQAQSL
jgi:hypothetical protein